MLEDLVKKNRSYRRYFEDHTITRETLVGLVDLARLSASVTNRQPLKYYLSYQSTTNEVIFKNLRWAAYLKDWQGPTTGERPSAYVLILGDKNISQSFSCNHGIAAQSILLGATEIELGGCMIGSVDSSELSKALNLPEQYEILLAVALGKPKETVLLEEIAQDGDTRYWRDEQERHHVPKRKLTDIIIN